jgi:hypothetical protein
MEPTPEKMKTMRLDGMVAALAEQQQQPSTTQLSFDEPLGFLVDAEWTPTLVGLVMTVLLVHALGE